MLPSSAQIFKSGRSVGISFFFLLVKEKKKRDPTFWQIRVGRSFFFQFHSFFFLKVKKKNKKKTKRDPTTTYIYIFLALLLTHKFCNLKTIFRVQSVLHYAQKMIKKNTSSWDHKICFLFFCIRVCMHKLVTTKIASFGIIVCIFSLALACHSLARAQVLKYQN